MNSTINSFSSETKAARLPPGTNYSARFCICNLSFSYKTTPSSLALQFMSTYRTEPEVFSRAHIPHLPCTHPGSCLKELPLPFVQRQVIQVWNFTEHKAKQVTVLEADKAVTSCPSGTALNSYFAFRGISSASQTALALHQSQSTNRLLVSNECFHCMYKTTETKEQLHSPSHLSELCNANRISHHFTNRYEKLAVF